MTGRRWLWAIAPVLVIAAVFAAIELAPGRMLAAAPAWLPHPGRTLGLKEIGGVSAVLQLDSATLKARALDELTSDAREALRNRQIGFSGLGVDGDAVRVRITDLSQFSSAQAALQALAGSRDAWETASVSLSVGPDQTLRLTPDVASMFAAALRRSVEVIDRRMRAMGVREPTVTIRAPDRIAVEAPGLSDLELFKKYVSRSGLLTFRMIDDTVRVTDRLIPPGEEMIETNFGPPLAMERRPVVTGAMLEAADVTMDQMDRPAIRFRLNRNGAERFAVATAQNVGKRFAIVIDDEVISAPQIQTPITSGDGLIGGAFTQRGAHDLAALLMSGPLPAPLTVVEARLVPAG